MPTRDSSWRTQLLVPGIHIGQQHLVSTVGSLLSSPSSFLFLRMFIFILFWFLFPLLSPLLLESKKWNIGKVRDKLTDAPEKTEIETETAFITFRFQETSHILWLVVNFLVLDRSYTSITSGGSMCFQWKVVSKRLIMKRNENSQGDRRRHTVVPGEPVTNQLLISDGWIWFSRFCLLQSLFL